jgi:hypothetical protein
MPTTKKSKRNNVLDFKAKAASCCGHSTERHETFDDDGHVCLTGFCVCGIGRLFQKPKPIPRQHYIAQQYKQGFK